MRGSLVLPGRGNATTLVCCTMSDVQEGTWGRYLTRRAPSWKRNPLHGGGQQGSHQHIHLPGLPFSNGAARSSRSSHSSDCVCITRFGVGAAGLGATLGLAMLPSNHATHDSTMESYTTSISWRSLEARRNKTGAAMHFLSSSRPPSELGRVFLVPVQPRETVFPARILSRCRDPRLSCHARLACVPACLKSLNPFSFFVYGAGIRGVQSRRPLSIAASRLLLQFWTGTAATGMAFRHRHRQSEFAPSSCPALPPFTPANESFST